MANIKKNFNFRNGVQVDDDNLLVTSTGLVGIGTTVPTEALDIRGNLNVSGSADITQANIGILTVTTLEPTKIIGAGISVVSGIVTATGSGIVTFYGDARFLQGMPTSQWADVDVGLGFTSIYNTGGNVGVATVDPRFTVQVGGDVDSSQNGVGISSVGNIKATGIVTASSFVGNLSGNITGATIISGNVDLNADIDVDGHTNLDNVSIAGIATVIDLDVDGHTNIDNVSVAGVSTFAGLLDVNGQASLQDVSVVGTTTFFPTGNFTRFFTEIDAQGGIVVGPVGFSTFNSSVVVSAGATLNELNVTGVSTFGGRIQGAATNNVIPFLYSSMTDLPSAGSYHGAVAHVHATGSLYYAHAGQWWELVNKESDGRVGTGTENYNIGSLNSAGIITATTELNSPLIGVGTDVPANPIQVRGTGNTEIQVTSDTGIAGLTVGRESGTGNTNNAEFRYGGGAGANYSSAQSLDILNYGTGNFNYHLSVNNPGVVAGDFHWHKGLNNERLMTLTNTGRLGIGLTTPSTPLHIIGAGTISGSLSVGNNLTVSGSLNSDVTGNVTGNLTGTVNGNVNATTGISTFNNVSVSGMSTLASARINSTFGIGLNASEPFSVNSNINNRVFVSASGNVGIKTTNTDGNTLLVAGSIVGQIIGAGTTIPLSTVDFSLAGQGLTGSFANKMFMIPPKVTNAQRGNLTGLVSGAMIYNTNLNKLQVYNGSAWETVTSS